MKIFTFTWNTQSVILDQNIRFIEKLKKKIDHDLLIFGLQEDSIRHNFIVDSLKSNFDEYEVVQETELSGWGSTTYKALKNLEYRPRGLRLIVFKRKTLNIEMKSYCKSYVFPSIKNKITWGKGAVIVYLEFDNKTMAIANLHLPFNSKSLIENRQPSLDWQFKCFNFIQDILLSENPDYIILLGDLNFRVIDDPMSVVEQINNKEYTFIVNDELKNHKLLEGVNNNGPEFPPSCKLFQNRNHAPGELVYNLGKFRQRCPSWCDRILYKNLECLGYCSFDENEIRLSDHSAVISEFEL